MKGNRIRQFGRIYFALAIFLVLYIAISYAQDISTYGKFTIARLKYGGGGDWYSDPSSLPNLLKFINEKRQ